MPDPTTIQEIREPWIQIDVFTPAEFIGQIMDLVTSRRGEFKAQEYLDQRQRSAELPHPAGRDTYRLLQRAEGPDARVCQPGLPSSRAIGRRIWCDWTSLVNKDPVDALSMIVHRDQTYTKGQRLVSKLKDVIPRQQFDVPIQAAVGNKVVSRANVKAVRKDVLAKCYGGDITRKRKLLEKQKAGKKRMKMIGSVEIPQEAFMTILKLHEE